MNFKDDFNNNYSLKDIINKISQKQLKEFLYNSLSHDSDLLNKFRVEFNEYFPKLSKENYKIKIYTAINNCNGESGYIDYKNSNRYEHAMIDFVNEAEKLVTKKDYNTAFTIVTIILDSIPETEIDDSNGSTGLVADSCIEIIDKILEEVNCQDKILKDILDYVIKEIKTLRLNNYGICLYSLLQYFINKNLYIDEIEKSLKEALDD